MNERDGYDKLVSKVTYERIYPKTWFCQGIVVEKSAAIIAAKYRSI